MATDSQLGPSFSPRRKWSICFNVILLTFLVLAVVVMVNYLSRDYCWRFHVSTHTRIELSPRTVGLLKSLTNRVTVTLYYEKDNALYSTVTDLLNEYRLVNPRISVLSVDYTRDLGAAQKVKAQYSLSSVTDKNLVIFDCEGKVKVMDGNALAKYAVEQDPNEKQERHFIRKITAFLGETAFNAALLDVTSLKPLKACFLIGHGEHQIDSGDEVTGYMKFAAVLRQSYIQPESLSLLGTNAVPMDCNLLVIAGPRTVIPQLELGKIEQYLKEGGRLLALFNFAAINKETGLEALLTKWGVEVGHNVIKDPDYTTSGSDIVARQFSNKHPLVNPLLGSGLQLYLPRSVGQTRLRNQAPDAPSVEELGYSGPRAQAFVDNNPAGKPQRFPLIVAVEKGAIKDVITERGTTRMVVAGDSIFLVNRQIDSADNRAFAGYAVNWLLERTQLVQGPGPRPVKEYTIVMTQSQLQSAQWILLGGLPGAVLLLGGLVWLRRRR
jgi:ABC-type uncharacterized transport system involved in gliding motility auxiliary subunit